MAVVEVAGKAKPMPKEAEAWQPPPEGLCGICFDAPEPPATLAALRCGRARLHLCTPSAPPLHPLCTTAPLPLSSLMHLCSSRIAALQLLCSSAPLQPDGIDAPRHGRCGHAFCTGCWGELLKAAPQPTPTLTLTHALSRSQAPDRNLT